MPKCDICGSEWNGFECDWPVEKFVRLPATSLKIGDVVKRFSERKSRGVAYIDKLRQLADGMHFVRLKIIWPWKEQIRRMKVPSVNDFLVKRTEACRKRVCDQCMIERDPEKMVLCSEHWFPWDGIA